MTPVLTDAQLAQFHNDGFVVLPKFASEEACLALRERAMQLAKEHVPSPEQATIFTADSTAKHAADQYFLSSGDKIRCFFEKDAFEARCKYEKDNNILNKYKKPTVPSFRNELPFYLKILIF
jgi:hypothetical protein